MIRALALLTIFASSAGFIAAYAEEPEGVRILDAKVVSRARATEEVKELTLARRMMHERNFEAASALLEVAYENDPANPVVANLLLICYGRLGYHAKSEAVSRRLVEIDPRNYIYRLRLAEALARQARTAEADSAYRQAVALVDDSSLVRYRTILNSMMNHQFGELSMEVIDTVRARLADSAVFALERGQLLEERHDYSAATAEFYQVLADSGQAGSESEKRLLALLSYPGSSAEVEKALLSKVDEEPNARAASILSSHYLKAAQFERAYDFALIRDSTQGQKGAFLLVFMRNCRERGLNALLVRTARYVLERYSEEPVAGEAYFLYAGALRELGSFEEAIQVYNTIVATFPRVQEKAEALYQVGDIYLNSQFDYARALAAFDSVIGTYNRGYGYLKALLRRPHCFLRQGRLKEARDAYRLLLDRRLNEDQQEEADYHLALIRFFDKQFDSSAVALRKLTVDYPRGYYVNDALQLLLLIEEAGGATELLYDFSNALLFEQMRQLDSTAMKLQRIADDSNRSLADVALYRLALLSLARFDSTATVDYVDRLVEEFPESYYLPFGLKAKADILLARPDGIELARPIYRQLLEEYPNYPFITEVRQKVREMEGEA